MPMLLADDLFAAAEDESLSPAELRAWMRRAAIHLQKIEIKLDAEFVELINEMRAEDGQVPLVINAIVKDWLIAHGRLRPEELEKDSETMGSA
jgi:hypothetical protein